MEDSPVILQKLRAQVDGPIEKARRYYSVLFAFNNIYIPPLELNLLAYIAVKGSISTGGAKEQFCNTFKTTKASIGNAVYKLTKKGFLIKINNRTKVIDALQLDFNKDLLLNVKIERNGREG